MVGAYEGMDNGFANDESRWSLLPMVSFDLGRSTTLHLDGEYYDQRGRGYRHSVPVTAEGQRGDFSRLPWDLNIASPDDGWRGWNASAGLRLDARLSPRASLHMAGRFTTIDGEIDVQALAGLAPGRPHGHALPLRREERLEGVPVRHIRDLRSGDGLRRPPVDGRVRGGPQHHGQRDRHRRFSFHRSLRSRVPSASSGAGPAAHPQRDRAPGRLPPGPGPPDEGPDLRTEPALEPAAGGRPPPAPTAAQDTEEATSVFSPSAGLVFLPIPWLSIYGIYAEGFESPAPGQFLEGGRPLEPVESRSFEGGAKAELLGRRLSLNAAAFRMRQTNVTEIQPRGFYLQIGEGESEGIELEAVGSPARGLALRGGYAWTRTEITRDTAGFTGRELPNAPPTRPTSGSGTASPPARFAA